MDSDHFIHHLEDPANAIAPYPSFYEGPRIDIDLQPETRQGYPPAGDHVRERFDDNCTLWVGNLDLRISETVLFELFSQVGDVRNITFPKQKQDEEKTTGFCFVNFLVPDSVPKAIDLMQGTVLFGRRLFLKCRPDSIHAMNKPSNCRTVKVVKKLASPGYRSRSPHLFSSDTGKSGGNYGKSRVRELRGENRLSDSPSNKVSSSVFSSGARYSPIRAPSPEGSSKALKLRRGKVTSPEGKSFSSSCSDSSARRKVVIRSSSGSIVPVINVENSVEPKLTISSVVVTPPQKSTAIKPAQSAPSKPFEAEMVVQPATSTTATPSSRDLPPHPERHSFQNYNTVAHNITDNYERSVHSRANSMQVSGMEMFQYAQNDCYTSYEQSNNNFQQWRPPLHGSINPHLYPAAQMEQQAHPVAPHYNRYVWFNGNSRYQNNNLQRFRPNYQPRQNAFPQPQQAGFGNYNPHIRPPRAFYNPRFANFRPMYNNEFHANHMQFQPPPRHPTNYYNDNNSKQEVYPPPPPRLRSRSRTRSRSRSKSPYRSRYLRDRSRDKFNRIDRSRSPSPSHRPRRSNSRESSYDRYHHSRRASRSSSSESDDYHVRKRHKRSRSYSSSIERQKARELRTAASSANNSRNSSVSRESDRERKVKVKEALNSTTDSFESGNDPAAVSSSSHKVAGIRKKLRGRFSHKSTPKTDPDKQGKNKTFRRSSRGSEAEEYDPSDPGY